MTATTDEYSYLWKDKAAGWVLVQLPPAKGHTAPCYVIENRRSHEALIIENDALASAVIVEMLRHGVPVVGPRGS